MSRRKQARPIRHLDDIDGAEDAANATGKSRNSLSCGLEGERRTLSSHLVVPTTWDRPGTKRMGRNRHELWPQRHSRRFMI